MATPRSTSSLVATPRLKIWPTGGLWWRCHASTNAHASRNRTGTMRRLISRARGNLGKSLGGPFDWWSRDGSACQSLRLLCSADASPCSVCALAKIHTQAAAPRLESADAEWHRMNRLVVTAIAMIRKLGFEEHRGIVELLIRWCVPCLAWCAEVRGRVSVRAESSRAPKARASSHVVAGG